jgi:hypothetical protein
MKKNILFILVLFLAVNLSFSQNFEGSIKFKMSYEGEGVDAMSAYLPQHYIMDVKDNNIRMKIEGGMMESMMGDMLVTSDMNTYIIKHDEQVAYVMTKDEVEEQVAEFDSTSYEVIDLKETEKILKYKCKKYKVVSNIAGVRSEQIVWVTDKLQVKFQASESTPASQFSLEKYGIKGMTLKTIAEINQAGMEITMTMEAVELEEKKFDENYFKVPEDYEIKSFDEFNMGF